MHKTKHLVGFGAAAFDIAIHIANRPPLDDYPRLDTLQTLQKGELAYIGSNTSNHWRKVFNVFAKFIFELRSSELAFSTWQEYRDLALLQAGSREALLFSAPDIFHSDPADEKPSTKPSKLQHTKVAATKNSAALSKKLPRRRPQYVKIIAGKTYAKSLKLPFPLDWQDEYFAINTAQNIIVSPYLDYRQLSNTRISQLVAYVKNLRKANPA